MTVDDLSACEEEVVVKAGSWNEAGKSKGEGEAVWSWVTTGAAFVL